MITYKFTAETEVCKIFAVDPERITRFDVGMLECPIRIFVPFYSNTVLVERRIRRAIRVLIARLNEDFTTGVKA